MPLLTPIANALWTASNLPAYGCFRHALQNPRRAQNLKLQELVRQNVNTAFGQAHAFGSIRNYQDFIQRVPLSDYDSLQPWITRIRSGEHKVLTNDTVTHLIPTSGSTGARKLIPFTMSLQREFNAAIGPWLVDLACQFPGLIGGRAYWSITPALGNARVEESSVPIGFDTDTAYLGGARKKLAAATMATPSNVGRMTSVDEFRYETLLCLLRCPDLRLISVWHPSFLTLLLDALPQIWDRLLQNSGLPKGLRNADPHRPETIWPRLQVISCWGDGAASLALPQLRNRFPHALIQPKGLIATEAFVTLPFRQLHPLAVASHFYEFIDWEGEVLPLKDLREGSEYELVVTTGGGLWRYRLGDRVLVDGFIAQTPSLRFMGRQGNLSDRFGEKLSEEFIVKSMETIFNGSPPSFALLAPEEDQDGCRYTLYVQGCSQPIKHAIIDQALRENPHYAYCRDLGQLQCPRVFAVSRQGYEAYCNHRAIEGTRLGDVKPAALSLNTGWSSIFKGAYVEAECEQDAPLHGERTR
jgi:GH3 auxin-responsive promoter